MKTSTSPCRKGNSSPWLAPTARARPAYSEIARGSIAPDSGSIILADKDIVRESEHRRARRMGRVYQNPAMGHLRLDDHPRKHGAGRQQGQALRPAPGTDRRRVEAYKELLRPLGLGLENMMNSKVGALSGGQRQALSLIMSSMTPIEFLILDEHTAALDPKTAEIIMQLTDRIVREKKLTALMVTHNLRYALEYGDRLIMMHQGGIVLDKAGEEKQAVQMDDILKIFNEISIECGN